MKKIIAIFAAVLALCLVFTGCGGMDRTTVDSTDDITSNARYKNYEVDKNNFGLGGTNTSNSTSRNNAVGYGAGANINTNSAKGSGDILKNVKNAVKDTLDMSKKDTNARKANDRDERFVDYYNLGKSIANMHDSIYRSDNGRVAGVNDTSYYSSGALASGLLLPKGY